jgi:tetratricopeptide (TPR) repeat protein
VKKGVWDLDHYHTTPAINEMATGSLYRSIMGNLDFSLRHSPNHHLALQTLIRYDRAGGKPWDFAAPECYLHWAQEFTPDDAEVWILGGYYFWTKKQLDRSEALYKHALELQPDSADAHYNLGLLYAQMQDYGRALEHAHAAYGAGYPLQGLRKILERAGKWRDPPSDAAPASSAATATN